MVPPNHSWVGVEKYELHPFGQDFRFAIWPASMVHPTASVGAFSGGHGGGFVTGGSPFLSKVSNPTLPRAGRTPPPQPSPMDGTPCVGGPRMDTRQSPALSLRACS